MEKKIKPQLYLPFLRFKGFEGEWEKKRLGDISAFYRGKGIPKSEVCENGKNSCILYGEIFTTYKTIVGEILSKTNDIGYMSKNNSLLFPSSSTSLDDFFPCISLNENGIHLGADISIFEIDNYNDSNCLAYMFSKLSHMRNIFRLTEGVTINHLYGSDLKKYKFYLPKTIDEQQKIAKFFSLLDKRISLWERKLELYLLFYRFYKSKVFKSIVNSDIKINFNEMFKEVDKVNSNLYDQYTIGKRGLELVKLNNYDISKHKVFLKNQMILGLGVEEVQINDSVDKGCCSPIYKTFNITNDKFINYFKIFMKDILWRKKAFITKTSTRREYEFDYKDLFKTKINIPNYNELKNVDIIVFLLNYIQLINSKISLLQKIKKYFLNSMFI